MTTEFRNLTRILSTFGVPSARPFGMQPEALLKEWFAKRAAVCSGTQRCGSYTCYGQCCAIQLEAETMEVELEDGQSSILPWRDLKHLVPFAVNWEVPPDEELCIWWKRKVPRNGVRVPS